MFWSKPPVVPPEEIDGVYALICPTGSGEPGRYVFERGRLRGALHTRESFTEGRIKISGDRLTLKFAMAERLGPGDFNYRTLGRFTWRGRVHNRELIDVVQTLDYGGAIPPSVDACRLIRVSDYPPGGTKMTRRETLSELGRAVALKVISEFREDRIWDLQAFQPQYARLTSLQKAQWIGLRLATLLRCFVQEVPNQAERDLFVTPFLAAISEAGIGITLLEFIDLRRYEAELCSVRHRFIERRALLDLLVGYWGAFVVPQAFTLDELKALLSDVVVGVVFDEYRKRGMPPEMELSYVEMTEFHRRFMVYVDALMEALKLSGFGRKAQDERARTEEAPTANDRQGDRPSREHSHASPGRVEGPAGCQGVACAPDIPSNGANRPDCEASQQTPETVPSTKKPINRSALTGFVLGLVSIPFSWIGIVPLVGFVFSILGLARYDPRRQRGRWMAVTGAVLNALCLAVNAQEYAGRH